MVMKRNATNKNLLRTIKSSFGRFLAIVLIIALGAAMFVGLLSTKSDMVATGQKYLDEQNMFDLRLISTYGWTDKEVEAVAKMAGVACAEGQISMDAVVYYGDEAEGSVYKLHSIPQQINQVYLMGGRMPQSPDECLLDGFHVGDEVLGTEIRIADSNSASTLDNLACHTYTVVGYVSTPLYMDMSRGSTSLGSGSVAGYIYLMGEAFAMDAYTEIAVTMEGDYEIYSDAFTQALEDMAAALEPHVTLLAQDRFGSLLADAQAEYDKGLQEYEDGLAEFEAAREEALAALEDGFAQLETHQKEIDDNWAVVNAGYAELDEAQALLDEQKATLADAWSQLRAAKAETYGKLGEAYAQLTENEAKVKAGLAQVVDGIAQIDDALVQIDDGIVAIEDGLNQIAEALPQLETAISLKQMEVTALNNLLNVMLQSPFPNQETIAKLQEQLAVAQGELDEYLAQQEQALAMQEELTAQLETLKQQRTELVEQRETLVQTKAELEASLAQIEEGLKQVEEGKLQADIQFASLEAELDSAQTQLDDAQAQLDAARAELDTAAEALTQAQAELDEGKRQYEEEKAEVLAQLAEVETELADAQALLAEAKEAIDSMEPVQLYILDRNSNTGYLALDNNSDIVSGVSRVFPAFFLLVAALVCITTMTRMVEEERTQIGTMKALGYSNWKIISKYIYYAGSAAIVGCGLGTLLGSVIFPVILWNAYKIILHITPNIVLQIDWQLCGVVVFAYTAVMLLVTWYCCRRALKEVPAELIRPKAPAAGKKIFLEHLPFWHRFSFLNKVMLRNVFRYHQRMLMMLVGVGGCTALLLTGFGLRDSLVNIASDQFEKVTVYDMSVYFSDAQTQEQQDAFLETVDRYVDQAMFYYQTSVTLEFSDNSRDLYLLVGDEQIENFIYFTEDAAPLGLPGLNEVFLSAGIAENMGIREGDQITLTDADMHTLSLTVAGVYDNMVSNYAYIMPETYIHQLGKDPGYQMAFVNVPFYRDVHESAAEIGKADQVMNVMITADTADQVTYMLKALDLLVLTVVICAGALAVIVLYNLTNINITERIREIATIKVLGFHNMESAMYVFKENLLLSAMGTAVGILLGKYLLDFVVSQIKVDIVFFSPQISWISCVAAIVLTMLAAVLVDCLLYFKLNKINMAEALKSVE